MVHASSIGTATFAGKRKLFLLIKDGAISLGGNKKLKIYGTMNCRSGKRMLEKNQVFFKNREEALQHGFRPCAHCLYDEYKSWKYSDMHRTR